MSTFEVVEENRRKRKVLPFRGIEFIFPEEIRKGIVRDTFGLSALLSTLLPLPFDLSLPVPGTAFGSNISSAKEAR